MFQKHTVIKKNSLFTKRCVHLPSTINLRPSREKCECLCVCRCVMGSRE